MLKLKKLQVLGFKSFCDRTELKFHGEGIAAIVGPNGCGKSNISDAISWVLGEQSAKSLRGVHMQDVIFAGTRDRKPTGMAEVSLTLIDPTVYEGDTTASPEIDIQDGFPADTSDDWDEASVRAKAAEETESVTKEAQPGQVIGEDGQPIVMDSDACLEHEAKAEAEAEAAESSSEAVAPKNEVVLKIRRRKFSNQQLKAGEIVVTRRLFRSGDSEYLLNGKLCRLRDIQDLFMGTGLGPESYAIIEQGRIGQILSSKPHDRRAIIEEAAGITKYKTRKRLAELRLESAKLNLSRINDIFEEVTRQMNSLKRQAAKAERYSALRDEMRVKLRIVLASRFKQLDSESERVHTEIEQLTAELHEKTERVTALENEHNDRQQQGYALETDINSTRERLNAIAMEADRTSARCAHNEERCVELVSRVAGLEGELVRSQEQMQSLSAESAANRLVLESAAAEEAAGQAEAQSAQLRSQEAAIAVADAERRQEGRRAQVLDVMHESNKVRTQIAQSEERISALDRESERLEREIAAAFADVESMGGKRGQLGIEFETQSQHVQALTVRISSVRSELAEKRHFEIDGKNRLDGMRAEYATALGKRNSLDSVINEHGYSTESVKRLFQSGALGAGRAPVGVLADFLAVDEKHEGVIEDFLRDELNYIVVKSWDAVDEGLNLLKTGVDGRATFLVHPSDAQARFSFAIDETRRPASPPRDSVVPLNRCIQVLDGFGKSLEVILPKLRDGYIASDAKIARELALENPDAFYLAPSGETFHNVTVTGGKQRSEGPLSLKRELRDVTRIMSELEGEMRSQEAKLLLVHREIEELTALLDRLEGELREAEKQALTQGHALKQMESEIARTEQRVNAYRVEAGRVRGERNQRESEVAQRREELSVLDQRRQTIESEIASAQAESEQCKQARDAAAIAAMEAASRLATLEERRRGASASLTRIESLLTEVSGRVESVLSQIGAAKAEREQREQENTTLAERLIVLAQEREAVGQQAQTLQRTAEELRTRLLEIDAHLKQARLELDAVRERKGELAATAAKLESDTAHMAETCLNDLNMPADELRADTTIEMVEGEALAAEDTLYREMRQRLDAMGPVNMMALEEYKESAERHGFLETQRKDLLDSIENTQNTIKEIDEVSRKKFEEAFHIINENFQRTFTKLFGGGQGFMRLTDMENSAESGIDIVASPPGKKLQNVLLLSGGEKALTALALLVGIFQYQPSPFCILDEVDAPLDESNVGRFADMVKEMSSTTQFILITHSKRTMQAAPVMYGVTMQEPGVSKVVSVKFGDPAMKQAASA